MYFPYMLARERECFSIGRAHGVLPLAAPVIPIIEPICKPWTTTKSRGLEKWLSGKRRLMMIVNPHQHDSSNGQASEAQSDLLTGIEAYEGLLLTVRLSAELTPEELAHIQQHHTIRAFVHVDEQIDHVVRDAVMACPVQFHVFDVNTTSLAYRKQFEALEGHVALDTPFQKAAANRLYSEDPEFFHCWPAVFKEKGYCGFADLLIEDGILPQGAAQQAKAAAIHLTYALPDDNAIMLRHFVGLASENEHDGGRSFTPPYSDLFYGALEKIKLFMHDNPNTWLDSNGVRLLFELSKKPTNVLAAEVKEYSLLHHIELMHRNCTLDRTA